MTKDLARVYLKTLPENEQVQVNTYLCIVDTTCINCQHHTTHSELRPGQSLNATVFVPPLDFGKSPPVFIPSYYTERKRIPCCHNCLGDLPEGSPKPFIYHTKVNEVKPTKAATLEDLLR